MENQILYIKSAVIVPTVRFILAKEMSSFVWRGEELFSSKCWIVQDVFGASDLTTNRCVNRSGSRGGLFPNRCKKVSRKPYQFESPVPLVRFAPTLTRSLIHPWKIAGLNSLVFLFANLLYSCRYPCVCVCVCLCVCVCVSVCVCVCEYSLSLQNRNSRWNELDMHT